MANFMFYILNHNLKRKTVMFMKNETEKSYHILKEPKKRDN